MSEANTTPEELVEDIQLEVEDSEVIPTPIDPTLTHSGEAADAKAVGDALQDIASRIKVNNKTADGTGNINVYATDIAMSNSSGAQTVSEAIDSAGNKSGDNILYKAGETPTIAETVDEFMEAVEEGVSDAEIDNIFEEW